jgi:hypothetical protein
MHNGMTVITEAEIRGHWQAAKIMRARTGPTRLRPGPQWAGFSETGPIYQRQDIKPSHQPPTTRKRGQVKPSCWGQMKPS